MKIALAKSYNLAAVHLLDQVGVQTGAQMVRRLGITQPMAPSLPSALGASEASLVEMVSAYSTFPNKGVRVQPHLIRKVLDRDGKTLEQWEKTTYKVTSEYVALSMVEMMQGVTRPGGTAPGASAAGFPLAGKTGTVNNHTDVWFIGYTPTYVTGVWMGNPRAKVSLGRGMTGGGGALPYFNSFMSQFMKDKKRDSFPKAPDIPAEIKSLVDQRKREQLEKLEKAEAAGNKIGGRTSSSTKSQSNNGTGNSENSNTATEGGDGTTTTSTDPATPRTPAGGTGGNPAATPVVKKTPAPAATPKESGGTKRKGKKGDN
jgi:penicillin-binding protein 1A